MPKGGRGADVPSILLELHANPEVQLAYVSRTGEPAWAEEAARPGGPAGWGLPNANPPSGPTGGMAPCRGLVRLADSRPGPRPCHHFPHPAIFFF